MCSLAFDDVAEADDGQREPDGEDAGLERQVRPVEQPADDDRRRTEERAWTADHQEQGGGGPQRGEDRHDVRKARPEMTPNGPSPPGMGPRNDLKNDALRRARDAADAAAATAAPTATAGAGVTLAALAAA